VSAECALITALVRAESLENARAGLEGQDAERGAAVRASLKASGTCELASTVDRRNSAASTRSSPMARLLRRETRTDLRPLLVASMR
jgi:hypothetical protein